MARCFFSYSHVDEDLRDQLEVHLTVLKRNGVLETWHDRRISAGDEFAARIDDELNKADIILFLVSPDFLASNYCYDIELKTALRRHESNEAVVVPVVLRPCQWLDTPLAKLNGLPTDGKPVTKWTNRDEAWLSVANSIKELLSDRDATLIPRRPVTPQVAAPSIEHLPRSGNLRIAKQYTQRDKDKFVSDTFDLMRRLFENSLEELQERHSEIETDFRLVDNNRFQCAIYRNGDEASACTVFMGGMLGGQISYVGNRTTDSNTFNEGLTVHHDDQKLFLRPFGMSAFGSSPDKLTSEGAAEFLWSILIRPLQQSYR